MIRVLPSLALLLMCQTGLIAGYIRALKHYTAPPNVLLEEYLHNSTQLNSYNLTSTRHMQLQLATQFLLVLY